MGMRQGIGLTWTALLVAVFLVLCLTVTRHPLSGMGFGSNILDDNTDESLTLTDLPSLSSSKQQQEEAKRRLLADVDAETLARYKADRPGFRRHPSYYSDKYLRRALRQDSSFGSWNLVDTRRASRPGDDFYNKYPNRDVPWADFPSNAWQKDADYLPKFLDEGIALVERGLEAILTEYGFGKDRSDGPFEERIKRLGPKVGNGVGAATMPGDSYKGLIRRVLHAVVTEDTFNLAMSGHSSAAGMYYVISTFVLTTLECSLNRFISALQDMETISNNRTLTPTAPLWSPFLRDWEFIHRLEISVLVDLELSKPGWPRRV